MTRHFHKELEKIKKKMLTLGAIVEERVSQAIHSVMEIDAALAEKIIRSDHEIDEKEVELEEEVLKVMALHQPVAVDLRFLIAMLKINNDIERIGDMAVNIAERVVTIAGQKRCEFFFDYSDMAGVSRQMLKKALDTMVDLDSDMAKDVIQMDDVVDQFRNQAYDEIKTAMRSHPDCLGYLINLFLISRHLERIADHATNIAEEIVYMIEGEIIRHQENEKEGK